MWTSGQGAGPGASSGPSGPSPVQRSRKEVRRGGCSDLGSGSDMGLESLRPPGFAFMYRPHINNGEQLSGGNAGS